MLTLQIDTMSQARRDSTNDVVSCTNTGSGKESWCWPLLVRSDWLLLCSSYSWQAAECFLWQTLVDKELCWCSRPSRPFVLFQVISHSDLIISSDLHTSSHQTGKISIKILPFEMRKQGPSEVIKQDCRCAGTQKV